MNIVGTIHSINETQQVTATFTKREFVLEFAENPMYPQYILFQLVQDRVGLIDGYKVGDEVNVEFNLRGRQWTSPSGETKYFNSLEAWRINPVEGTVQGSPAEKQAQLQPVASGGPVVDVTKLNDDDD